MPFYRRPYWPNTIIYHYSLSITIIMFLVTNTIDNFRYDMKREKLLYRSEVNESLRAVLSGHKVRAMRYWYQCKCLTDARDKAGWMYPLNYIESGAAAAIFVLGLRYCSERKRAPPCTTPPATARVHVTVSRIIHGADSIVMSSVYLFVINCQHEYI